MGQRLWLLLLLLQTVTVIAEFPEIKPNDTARIRAIKKVFQTWDKHKVIQYNDNLWRDSVSDKRIASSLPRSKAYSTGKSYEYCNVPGYTGANCEFPICEQTNYDVPSGQSPVEIGAETDALMLPNCKSSMTTVFDSKMSAIYIGIDSDQPIYPTFFLYNKQGERIYPTSEQIQTNTYTTEFSPQKPGTYIIQAAAASESDAQCFVLVRAVTTLEATVGFTTQTSTLQSERNDFPEQNPVAYVPSTFVVHVNDLSNPGSLVTATFYENFNVMVRPQKLSTRYNCGYEYYAENFYCTNSSHFYYKLDGIDFYGNKFRRVGGFECKEGVAPPTASAAPAPVECQNNGVLMTDTDGTKYCYCNGLFHGRDCSKILCMNGGTGLNEVCLCPTGFSGDHCQDVQCIQQTEFGFGTDNPTLILAIHTKLTMQSTIDQLKTALQQVHDYYEAVEENYLRRFAVLLFNNKRIINTVETTHFADVLNAITNIVTEDTKNCDDSVFTAIQMALSSLITNRSVMYLFTDALPNDESKFETIFHLNSYWKAPIYVFLLEPPASSKCTLDLYHNAFLTMEEMTKRTSGHMFYVPTAVSDKVGEIFSTHMIHVFHRSSLMHSYDTNFCQKQPQYQPISVDKRLSEIVVTAVGSGLTLNTIDPVGTSLKQSPTLNVNNVYIWSLKNPALGQWMFSITGKANTACSYRIYSTQSQDNSHDEYDMFWGFSPGLMWDAPFIQPVEDENLAFVAHLNNYVLNDASKVFAELIVYKETENGRENVFASNGIWRDKCSYQFYFPPMNCTKEDELLYYSMFVRDELGTMIQRGGVAYCAKEHPTVPPPTDCMNGGVELTSSDNKTSCLCRPDWTGSKCEDAVCHNGGTAKASAGGHWCQCPSGFNGEHCEIVTCLGNGPGESFSPLNRDLAFVIDMTSYASHSLYEFKNYLSSLIRDIEMHHNEWFANYVLVGYNTSWAEVIAVARRHQQDYFINAVENAYEMMSANQDSGCYSMVYHAIGEALEFIRTDSHIIVLHASGTAHDSQVIDVDYGLLEAKRISLDIFYLYDYKSGSGVFRCGSTYKDYEALNKLAEINQGRAYPVDDIKFNNILPMISTFYLSGEVYRRVIKSCEQPVNIYFPVDSFTQTIQITTIGYNNQMKVYRPDGTSIDNMYRFINDGGSTGWEVAEYRRACDLDEEWEDSELHYCAQFHLLTANWTEAAELCHKEDAFMVDELNNEKTTWLNNKVIGFAVWIGLKRADNGIFYWDRLQDSKPTQLNKTYEMWDNNEPSSEATKNCVVRGTNGKWKMADCSEDHFYICQRHKYDQFYEPHSILDDLIPAGKWRVEVKTDPVPADFKWPVSGCEVEVRVQSSLQVFPNFVLDQHSDIANEGASAGSDRNRIISHIYGDDSAVLRYANMYDYETMEMIRSATYEKREMCVYPWLTQNWQCPDSSSGNNRFAIIHSGSDINGQTFQRMTTGSCINRECHNGFPSAGECVCMDYWAGVQCDTPQCVNGGSLDSENNVCKCPDGYIGDACQYAECLPQVPATFSTDGKTFVLLVELTEPNRAAVESLASNVKSLITDVITNHSGWFSNILLLTFDSQQVLTNRTYETEEDFIFDVEQLPHDIQDPGTVCGAPLFEAVMAASRSSAVVKPNSILLTVTRSVPNDYSDDNRELLAGVLSTSRLQLYYLVIDDNERVCGYAANDARVDQLSAFALATGGNFFIIPKNMYINFLLTYLPTLYSTTLLTTPTITDNTCKQATWYAQVDYYTEAMYITVFTAHGAFGILDPQSDITPYEIIYENKKTTMLKVDTTNKPGIYTLKVTSPTLCYAQVRGASPLMVWPGYVWLSGTTDATHVDDPKMFPVHGNQNSLIFHLSGERQPTARLTYTELINPYDESVKILPLYRRYNCSYEFYTDQFDCPDNDFLVMVNGVDDRGQNFRREVELTQCRSNTDAPLNKRSVDKQFAKHKQNLLDDSPVPGSVSKNAVTSSLLISLLLFLIIHQ